MDNAERLRNAELPPDFTVDGYLKAARDRRRRLMGKPPKPKVEEITEKRVPRKRPARKKQVMPPATADPSELVPEMIERNAGGEGGDTVQFREEPGEGVLAHGSDGIDSPSEQSPKPAETRVTPKQILEAACAHLGVLEESVLGFTMKPEPLCAQRAVQWLIYHHAGGIDALVPIFEKWDVDGLMAGVAEAETAVSESSFHELCHTIAHELKIAL